MARRTRRQIEEESQGILTVFDEIIRDSEKEDLTKEKLTEELNQIVLEKAERSVEGAFTFNDQQQSLWQTATEEDIEDLKAIYLPEQKDVATDELKESSQSSAVEADNVDSLSSDISTMALRQHTESDHSDKISLNLLSSRIGKLAQTLGFNINRHNGQVEFEVEFGTQRPGGTQDRHISAYMLILEVFKSRLTGMEVEDAIDAIPNIVGEYIKGDSAGMRQFLDYSRQQQDLLTKKGVLTKEEREEIYSIEMERIPALQSQKRNLETYISENNGLTLGVLHDILGSINEELEKEEKRQNTISPMDARNKYKEADLWKYQECFASTLKAAVVTMNNMEMVSFRGQETASDRGIQGAAIKEAAVRLRNINNWDDNNRDDNIIVNDLVTLFDYPKKEHQTNRENIPRLFHRHMKLSYDSFAGFRGLDLQTMTDIMTLAFSSFRQQQEWPARGKESCRYPNCHENTSQEYGYVLPERFSTTKSRSLASAIKNLESNIKSNIEQQVEE